MTAPLARCRPSGSNNVFCFSISLKRFPRAHVDLPGSGLDAGKSRSPPPRGHGEVPHMSARAPVAIERVRPAARQGLIKPDSRVHFLAELIVSRLRVRRRRPLPWPDSGCTPPTQIFVPALLSKLKKVNELYRA